MDRRKLYFEDEYEALNLMISNSSKSVKEVAGYLFPHLKPDSAYARLKSCMNPVKDERLTFKQIITAMNFCESYEPLNYACDETFHHRPEKTAPEDEEVKLVQSINSAAETLEKALTRLDRLRSEHSIVSVRAVKR